MYGRGTGEQVVDWRVTLDKTERLIEGREKNEEKDKEERKSAGGTDGRGQGNCYG